MTFRESTKAYEVWLRGQIEIVDADLTEKHTLMRESAFRFLRATFYRWAELYPKVCPAAAAAPEVLAVGDLHLENFGTWRDVEGRLVWGINDFDEAAPMPWTIDLVRLTASVFFAVREGNIPLDARDAADAIADGYRDGLEAGGKPWVLGEKHLWLSELVDLRDPAAFWAKMNALPDFTGHLPKAAAHGIERMMPAPNLPHRIAHRVAGMGSRGRQRLLAIADFRGAHVCREAKALAPSAWLWAQRPGEAPTAAPLWYQEALDKAVRSLDPFVHSEERWIVRRLAPDCAKIELASVPRDKEKSKLLYAMGWETANLHVGSGHTAALIQDLGRRDKHWLFNAAHLMVEATLADWEEWRT